MRNTAMANRITRLDDSVEFESSATWFQGRLGASPEPSGSVGIRYADPLIRIRRPRPSPLLFEGLSVDEGSSTHVTFAVRPVSGWTEPSFEVAMLGVLGRVPCPPAEEDSFWSRVNASTVHIAVPPRTALLDLDQSCADWGSQAWSATGHQPLPCGDRAKPSVRDESFFRTLVVLWRRDTVNISSTSRIAMHPAYQRIIGMGSVAIPLILRELEEQPDWWFWALQAITGADPVSPSCRGLLHEMAAAWLAWGREHGYLAH